MHPVGQQGAGCQQTVECYHIQRILRPFYCDNIANDAGDLDQLWSYIVEFYIPNDIPTVGQITPETMEKTSSSFSGNFKKF